MFSVDEIMDHYIEDELLFRNISKRVPPVGPQELHLFIDRPMEAFTTSINDNHSFYNRKSHSSFAPGALRMNSGIHLRIDTWLNDDIIQAYTAPCNAITEHNKNCFFLGPYNTIGWNDQVAFINRVRSDIEKSKIFIVATQITDLFIKMSYLQWVIKPFILFLISTRHIGVECMFPR